MKGLRSILKELFNNFQSTHLNKQKIIKQCKKGNRQAEKELFFHFAGKVLSICRRYATSEQEAKDYMQEAFLHIFNNIRKYDERKGAFEGWLYQVATNRILELLRKKRRGLKIVYMEQLPELNEENEVHITQDISSDFLLSCIQELPDGYRVVLNLFIFEGLKHKEIADRLKISVSTSRSQFTRAKVLLKEKIQKKRGLKYERC